MTAGNSDSRRWQVFLNVHSELPREGPGSRESTQRALDLAKPLPAAPDVLDLGCGPGMQTVDLAELLPRAHVTAIDRSGAYVEEARLRAETAGLTERITVAEGDMASLSFGPQSFDLIWSEGAAYNIGVPNALELWRPLLRPGGRIAYTEATWLRSDPPEELAQWWGEGYPGMLDLEANRRLAREHGYHWVGDFTLPDSAWWDDYYEPMAERLDGLEQKYRGDGVAEEVLADCRREIDYFRRFSAYYGYVFYVLSLDS